MAHDCAGGLITRPGCIVVPIRTVGGMNVREHHMARARRVKAERLATAYALLGAPVPALPCIVTMTRVGPSNGLDDDNLAGSCKGVRDQIAKWLGLDDRDPRVKWQTAQRRGKQWQVEVTFA